MLVNILKGLWIGATLTVPGVSGGSMAMILGIYDKLIGAVNAFMKKGEDKKKAALFLLEVGLAGALGFVVLSRFIKMLMDAFPVEVCFFFAGAIAGGIPLILKTSGVMEKGDDGRRHAKVSDFLFVLVGAAFVVAIGLVPEGFFSFAGQTGFGGALVGALGGFIVAIGFVLPGISLSQMLYMLGLYGELMDKVSRLEILSLLPFGVGGILGVLFTAYVMGKVMVKFPRATYLTIFGFLLGSVVGVFSGVSLVGFALWRYVVMGALTVGGFAAIYGMSKLAQKE